MQRWVNGTGTDDADAGRLVRELIVNELSGYTPEVIGEIILAPLGPVAASVHDTSWSETILRLHVGEHAPVGYEIKRVVGHVQEPSGIGGTSWRDVYVVACRKVCDV